MTDPTDRERSWLLATAVTDTDQAARELLDEAREHAERLASTSEFREKVELVASALLTHGELDGEEVTQLIEGDQ